MTQIPDFRTDLAAAQEWIAGLMGQIRPDQWDAQTPCADYDVRGLVQHMSSLPAKVRAVAEGADPRTMPHSASIDEAAPGTDYLKRSTDALSAWDDDELLGHTVIAPWGEAPGGITLGGFLMETVTHGWDLAVATGQDAEADPALAAKAQAVAEKAVPEDRTGLPFAQRAEPTQGAGPTEALAAYLGRRRPVDA